MVNQELVISSLEKVMDPEIPTISVWDLGIVSNILLLDHSIEITLTPTFSGCPALRVMEEMVHQKLLEDFPSYKVNVKTSFETTWTTDRISEKGLINLKAHGLAPPPRHDHYIELDVLSHVACPWCGSKNTQLKSPFGPTLCRSLHYCRQCQQAFEQFKPV